MALAASVIDWCLAHGVREVVVCAGARDLALVATCADADGLRCWHFPEERSAGFFALGRIRAGGAPVAVMVTSGTAVAELLPATIEAHYLGLPMLLVTADRPVASRGTGAPQAIVQPGIFGPHAVMLGDFDSPAAMHPAAWDKHGPGQLNICFDEPVLDGAPMHVSLPDGPARPAPPIPPPPAWDDFGHAGRLLVMVGTLAAAERAPVARFLARLQAPVWLEATSNLWGEENLRPLWQPRLQAVLAAGPTHILRLGGVPCDRLWRDLEELPAIQVRSVSRQGWSGLARANRNHRADLARLDDWLPAPHPPWLGIASDPHPPVAQPQSEKQWVAALASAIPTGATVFLGNSLPIREWQIAALWRAGIEVFANRGANGIDGELSTFLGHAATAAGEAWGIFGDLTTLYDLAGPWILRQLPPRPIRLVVINNGGGAIFAKLPALASASSRVREFSLNRHQIDFSHWAAMWQLPYRKVTTADDLRDLPDSPVVLEIVPADHL